jgi:hypothetical protein
VLKSLSIQYQRAYGEDDSGPAAEKPVLGLVDAVVLLDVVVAEPVVEEMAPGFGAENADHGGQEEKCSGGVAEEVWWWFNELGYGCSDSNGPEVDDEKED